MRYLIDRKLILSLISLLFIPSCSAPEPTFAIKSPLPIPAQSGELKSRFPTFTLDKDLNRIRLEQDNQFRNYGESPFMNPEFKKFSTFGMDVDTASYTWMRKSLQNGLLPDKDSVRIEEYINYFDYKYSESSEDEFSIQTDLTLSPFGEKNTHLMRIGLQGKSISISDRKKANLTFVIDVSGSMSADNRLNLVKESLALLIGQLTDEDRVSIVVYGTEARMILESTSNKDAILNAISSLGIEGSTNVESGLKLGYQIASQTYQGDSINRVILCSDGVANVGKTDSEDILFTVKGESQKGITLSTVGFGMGNFNDELMEQLANQGDGNYSYVDTLKEARRVFVEELTGTLQVIAKDAKIQVDFNPQVIKYRLLGYENRLLETQDFRDDKVDGGEVGAGHSVTALYEIQINPNVTQGKIAEVFIRYKSGDRLETVKELSKTISMEDVKEDISPSFKLALAVSEYAEILRNSAYANSDLIQISSMIKQVSEKDPTDQKVKELIDLVQKAQKLFKK